MHGLLDKVFGPQGLAFSDGPKVYELTGHLGALGVVAVVLALILWAALTTALVLVIVELIRRQRHIPAGKAPASAQPARVVLGEGIAPGVARPGSEALRLLDERYARGELGREEYLERKTDLSGT